MEFVRDGIVFLLLVWNAAACILMGIDKWAATGNRRRIPESAFFTMAFAFGGIGVFIGMQAFSHKTKKTSFVILIPLAILINVFLTVGASQMFDFSR